MFVLQTIFSLSPSLSLYPPHSLGLCQPSSHLTHTHTQKAEVKTSTAFNEMRFYWLTSKTQLLCVWILNYSGLLERRSMGNVPAWRMSEMLQCFREHTMQTFT